MLVAEDLLLLLTDDRTGKAVVDSTRLDIALGGALLLELVVSGHAGITGPGGVTVDGVRSGRVVALRQPPVGDPVLDEGLRRLVTSRAKKPQSAVTDLGKDLRPALYHRLAERGILRVVDGTDRPAHRPPAASHPEVERLERAPVRLRERDRHAVDGDDEPALRPRRVRRPREVEHLRTLVAHPVPG